MQESIEVPQYIFIICWINLKECPSVCRTLGTLPHVYYICDTCVIHVWYFDVLHMYFHSPIDHLQYTCFTHLLQMYSLHTYCMCKYICCTCVCTTNVLCRNRGDTCVAHTCVIQCSTHVIYLKQYTWITCVAQLASEHSIQFTY